MDERLVLLAKMQKYDDVIGEKDEIKRKLPEKLRTLQENVTKTDADLKQAKAKVDDNIKLQKKKEVDINENKQQMQKYEGQLLNIKTNKEYKALNSEISNLKGRNTLIDDEVMVLMEEELKLKELLKIATENYRQASKELEDREDVIRQQIDRVEKEAEILRDKRNELAKQLNMNLVKRYAGLIKQKSRKAVVCNDKNTCSGCGIKIFPQRAIEIARSDNLISCENCGRILIDKDFMEKIEIEL